MSDAVSLLELEAQVARERLRVEDLQERLAVLVAELARTKAARADAEETVSHLQRDCARLQGRVNELRSRLSVAAANPGSDPATAASAATERPGAQRPQPAPAGTRPQPASTRARPLQASARSRPRQAAPTPRRQPPARPRPQSTPLSSYLERAEEAYDRLVPSDSVVWLVVLVVCLGVAILVLIGAVSL